MIAAGSTAYGYRVVEESLLDTETGVMCRGEHERQLHTFPTLIVSHNIHRMM